MNDSNLKICKANKVIEASYKLTLNEQRVVLACISQVDSVKELLTTDRFELTAKDFAQLFSISEDRAYSELKTVAQQLFHRYVIIENPDPENPKLKYTQTHWISSIDYFPDSGKIALYFAHKILPYLGLLRGSYTEYRLENISKMTSIYGIRLYELLIQWQSLGRREIEVEWLKKQFQIENAYDRMYDFKKYVIDPAVKDINEHSNFDVEWTQRKTGRIVTHLIFTFKEKRQKQTETKVIQKIEQPKKQEKTDDSIIERLVKLGFSEVIAKKYHKQYGKEQIERNITFTQEKQKAGLVKDFCAYLNNAITNDHGAALVINKNKDEEEKKNKDAKKKIETEKAFLFFTSLTEDKRNIVRQEFITVNKFNPPVLVQLQDAQKKNQDFLEHEKALELFKLFLATRSKELLKEYEARKSV